MLTLFSKNVQLILIICLGWLLLGSIGSQFAMIGVALVFGICFFKSRIDLMLLLFYCILFFSDSRSDFLSFAAAIKPGIALLFGVTGLLIWRKFKVDHPYILLFLPFIIVALVTVFFSDYFVTSLTKTVSYTFIILSVPVYCTYLLKSTDNRIFRDYFGVIFIILSLGLVFIVLFPDFVFLAGRYRGLLGNPNGMGLFLSMNYLFFQVVIRKLPNLFARKELMLIYISFFASLLLCQSRTAMIVILVFHSFFWINKRSPMFSFVFLILILLSYSVILTNAIWIIQNLGLGDYARLDTVAEGSGRVIAWEFIWEQIKNGNWMFGHGIGGTEGLFVVNYKKLSILGHEGNAHNTYLTIWYDLGLIGLLSFFFGMLGSFFKARKDTIIFPVIIGVLISANFESWLSASLNPFTIVVFLIITSVLVLENPKLLKTPPEEPNVQ